METSKTYWHLFTLTGSVEAYLLYREVFQKENIPVASTSESLE